MKKLILMGIFCASFALMSFTIVSSTEVATESVSLEFTAPVAAPVAAPVLHRNHGLRRSAYTACPRLVHLGACINRPNQSGRVRTGHCVRNGRLFHGFRRCR